MRDRRSCLAGVALALSLASCIEAPVERINPLDVGGDVAMRIAGLPDTIHSLGERHVLSLETSHPLPPGTSVTWRSDRFLIDGTQLTAVNTVRTPLRGYVEAVIGNVAEPRVVRKAIVEWRRPFRLALNCATCDMPELGMPLLVDGVMYDSLGNVASAASRGVHMDIALRDSSLFGPVPGPFGPEGFNGIKNGETWVVATMRERPFAKDSAFLRIWQIHRAIVPICPTLRFPGDTGRIEIDYWWDRAANRIEHDGEPPKVVWSAEGYSGGASGVSVTPDGFVTTLGPGWSRAVARFVPDSVDRGVPDQVRGQCDFLISSPPT